MPEKLMTRKIAIVTGSSKGIGKAIALVFANSKQYSGIVINARKIKVAQVVADQIKSLGCDSIAIEADISKEIDCVRLIEQIVKQYGGIDVLVNFD
jgi:NAD(P)-dependent dehydrogenase (short-subunit alcohol dehydrogenase family)